MAAFVLLSRLLVSVNGNIIAKNELIRQSEAAICATTLAQAMLQEVSLKAFDEVTITKNAPLPDSLTLRTSLGKEPGENFPYFDDLDDYKNYKRYTKVQRLDSLQTLVNVLYCSATGDSSGKATFYKKITVTVTDITNRSMKIPVQLSNIISY
jgi:hypothetical protein